MSTPLTVEDIQLVRDFAKDNPHLFPAGEHSLKTQMRNRKTNGLDETKAVVKQLGMLYIVKPNYLKWFVNQSQ
jgi:hypothetical protein